MNLIKPCADIQDSDYIKFIIGKIESADITKIVMNIILNGGQILKDITDAVNSFKSGNYEQFGSDIGDFVYWALLSSNKV